MFQLTSIAPLARADRPRVGRSLLAFGCLLLLLGQTTRAEEPIVLQLKWYHQFQFAGYYAAAAKGYYREAGLDVEIREGSPGRPSIDMVLSGQADFGVGDEEVLVARLRGRPIVACAAIFQHSPYIIMSRADSGITKPADLIGRSVMVAGAQGSTQLKAMLQLEGIPLNRVRLVPHTWKNADLIEGRVDAISAYSTVEPTQMRQAGVQPAMIRAADYGVDFYGDTLFTSEAMVKKDRARVAAFLKATRRGWEYAMSHPTEMIDLILRMPEVTARGIRRENLEVEFEEMRGLIQPNVVEIGHMNAGRWEHMADIFRETGLIDAQFDPDRFIFEAEWKPDRRIFWILGGVLAVALAGGGLALLWSFQLQRKVEFGTREVRRNKANLSALIENAPAAVWSVDRDYRLITFNALYREYTEEVAGRPVVIGMSAEEILPPAAAEEWKSYYDRAVAGEHFRLDSSYPMPRGVRMFSSNFSPIVAGGEVTGVTIFTFDVTEQRRIEEQLRQAQKMDAVGQLAGGVAHDFNNLLMVIQGNASLALMGGLPPEEIRAIFQDVVVATERAASLTGQLLSFSRRQTMQLADLEANAIIVEIARMLGRVIGEDIRLVTELTSEPTPIRADASLIEQVLLNLAVNARDAMPQGGCLTLRTFVAGANSARAAGEPAESFIRIEIVDTGTGIDPGFLPRIFEPFFTTKEVGKGSGLGLATAFGIVQQHGGRLNVSSQPGSGSTFTLCLPRRATVASVNPVTKSAPDPTGRGTETILLVEDDAAVRAVVLHTLKRHGYRIHEAANGPAALDVWAERGASIDLLLTDMVMPGGVNGHELAQRLMQRKPALKVIYMSGYSAEVFHGDFVLPDGIEFLRKPFQAPELLAIVRAALDRPSAA